MKKALSICILLILCLSTVSVPASAKASAAKGTSAQFEQVANSIIQWKKGDNGAPKDGFLINDTYLQMAGSTPGDWYPIGLGRLGIRDNNAAYLAVIKDRIETRYAQPGKLSSVKATEWHRISLAVLAMGGDPTNIGKDPDGKPINLIADGSYDRGKTVSLGRQGINGWIWGLLTVDAMRYPIPDGAFYSRDDIITQILCQQLADGGFALSGSIADPDITAMALQSLAPYYNSEKTYTYELKKLHKRVTKTVRQVVDESLGCLSKLQLSDGDFRSWGTQNIESTDQVVVALCSLQIDPLTDKRFLKGGKSLLDGILKYQMKDGGFVHSFTYDPDNPTSLPDHSNTMASEQTLYTMAAFLHQAKNQRTLYDFRPEQSSALKARISDLEIRIASLTNLSGSEQLKKLLADFYSLPEDERSYVDNYWTLSDMAKSRGIRVSAIADSTKVVESPADPQTSAGKASFTAADRKTVDSLPATLSTQYYVSVVTLLDKLESCEDFPARQDYKNRLTDAKQKIASIQQEIDSLNQDVLKQLYPFDKLSLKDKTNLDKIVARYQALTPYDRTKILRWEDVVKSRTKVYNELRALIIGAVCFVVCILLTVFLVRHIRKRRHAKALAMAELAAEYDDED